MIQTKRRIDRAIPEKPGLERLEAKWSSYWEAKRTYAFDRTAKRKEVFSIDTPPPTVSGSLHVGHVFSYTHTDIIARFQRMTGKTVFYPIGWDDNGLPTERRVENFYGVVCDSQLAYQPDFRAPDKVPTQRALFRRISRRNFIELCHQLTAIDEAAFRDLFMRLGLSVDWDLSYATIGTRAQRISQRALLRNLRRGELYQQEAPCLWDITFQTAVAQAELEDREIDGAWHDLRFIDAAGKDVIVSTTRPELLAACVALVVHPDDERYDSIIGTRVHCPLFGFDVPVMTHGLATPEKGSGIAMVCTFGDLTDVIWWRELALPTRNIIREDGRLRADTPEWIASGEATRAYAQVAGRPVHEARREIARQLALAGSLIGAARPIRHAVKFFEKGDRPLEIVATRQWYLRNGGRDPLLRDALLVRGAELRWHPPFMGSRYANWVSGLNGDWLISRQRVFGVPIPLWYSLDAECQPDYGSPIQPDEATLPVDPQSEVPPGYRADQRGQPCGFIGESDIMDTWATSSLTPQIATGWGEPDGCFELVYPMDLRPQAHDIIRTWLFSTVVRSHLESARSPWMHATISGWILDPDRKKMSKSKGNVVTPAALLDTHGPDGVRYWAALGRPGMDAAFDERQMRNGRRLALKLLHVSRFVLGFDESPDLLITEALDRAMIARLAEVVTQATEALHTFDYSKALEYIEAFFWWFCDDYVELVKSRAHEDNPRAQSAHHALASALSVLQRLLAPFLPFAAEECWSWWQSGSIHRAAWPDAVSLQALAGKCANSELCIVVSDVLCEVRRAKSEAKVSMKAGVSIVRVSDTATRLAALREASDDLRNAGHIGELMMTASEPPCVDVTL
ncbi:valine--tRNA ligase [Burkholderia seminalis]|uniref:valine--tRNA ligase n=1 Tax=Burkholderia seminalis TaxID=488731 RepID=UPI0019049955|nr:valine--tRNA ligase [Burkholderia seminalis]MBJ9963031.1 valine--tRNA ligase [Burkholderia seminalis]